MHVAIAPMSRAWRYWRTAGGLDIQVGGGASTVRQYIQVGGGASTVRLEILAHRGRPAADLDIEPARGLPGATERFLNSAGDEMKDGPAFHRDRFARVVRQHEHRHVIRRV